MAKNTNRVASAIAYVAALGLATGAWAQATAPTDAHWQLDVKEPVTFAQEIFGGDNPENLDLTLNGDDGLVGADGPPVVVAGRQGTRVELQLVLPTGKSVSATSENKAVAEVKIELTGAKFDSAVQWTDIQVGQYDKANPGSARIAKVSGSQTGGRPGGDSVTFKIETSADISDAEDDDQARVLVYLTSIQDAAGLKTGGTAIASASVTVTGGGTPNFPTKFIGRQASCTKSTTGTPDRPTTAAFSACGTWKTGATGFTDNSVADAVITASSGVVANSAKGLTFAGANGAGGSISIADRTKLGAKKTKVDVASLTYTKNAVPMNAANDKAFSADDGASANIGVRVSGMVRDADSIFFDANNNAKMDSKESLNITAGVATRTFRLANTKSGAKVYYAPGGTTPMRQGTINTSFAVEYDSTSAVNPDAVEGMAKLNYEGVTKEARAYAIPKPRVADDQGNLTGDIANVRIKCEAGGSSTCTVFLDCDEQNGMNHFGELTSTIGAGVTDVLQAAEIATVLGVDTWSGRLSCDVLSNNNVSVQVLVRSDGSVINNTYIEGPTE